MSRVEKFRQARKVKKTYIVSLLLFIIFTVTGLCAADYSINSLLENKRQVALISYEPLGQSKILIKILNREVCLDTGYLRRDMERVRKLFSKN